MPIRVSTKADFESVEDLPRTACRLSFNLKHIRICYHSSGCLQCRMVSKESERLCPMRKDFNAPTKFRMQEYINLGDWKGLEPSSTEWWCKSSVKKFQHSQTAWAESIELKEPLAKFKAARGKNTSDDKGSNDMTSKAERKQKLHVCIPRVLGWRLRMGFYRRLAKKFEATGSKCERQKRSLEIVQTLFTNFAESLSLQVVSKKANR